MADPTEPVIIATFTAALGLFAFTANMRRSFKPKLSPAPVADAWDEDSDAPLISAEPPEIPIGKVATWFYRPLDLLGIGLIFVVFFSLVIATVRASGKPDMELSSAALIQSIVFQFIIAGIAAAIVIPRIRPVEWLGLCWPKWPRVLLIAPASVLGMWAFFGGLQASGYIKWIESFGVESVQDTVKILQKSNDLTILGLMSFAAVIVAPLCEEIVFRGYLYAAMKKFSGPWVACLCSALIFAAAHGSFAALLPLLVFGCLLVFIYEKTGSLWAPMAVHFCFNGATVVIQMAARYYHIPLDVAP